MVGTPEGSGQVTGQTVGPGGTASLVMAVTRPHSHPVREFRLLPRDLASGEVYLLRSSQIPDLNPEDLRPG